MECGTHTRSGGGVIRFGQERVPCRDINRIVIAYDAQGRACSEVHTTFCGVYTGLTRIRKVHMNVGLEMRTS